MKVFQAVSFKASTGQRHTLGKFPSGKSDLESFLSPKFPKLPKVRSGGCNNKTHTFRKAHAHTFRHRKKDERQNKLACDRRDDVTKTLHKDKRKLTRDHEDVRKTNTSRHARTYVISLVGHRLQSNRCKLRRTCSQQDNTNVTGKLR